METTPMWGREPMPQLKMKGISLIIIVGLLVCCVIMQMVGVRASLWDSSHIADNSVYSSILSASALVTSTGHHTIFSVVQWESGRWSIAPQRVFVTSIFHPPDFS
jgi:predicted neutral ceramidase superfamily lipid hydrolase